MATLAVGAMPALMSAGLPACRADTLGRVRGEVVELKNVMVDNIEKVGRTLPPCLRGWAAGARSTGRGRRLQGRGLPGGSVLTPSSAHHLTDRRPAPTVPTRLPAPHQRTRWHATSCSHPGGTSRPAGAGAGRAAGGAGAEDRLAGPAGVCLQAAGAPAGEASLQACLQALCDSAPHLSCSLACSFLSRPRRGPLSPACTTPLALALDSPAPWASPCGSCPVQARVLRRHMWWQNARMALIIGALVLLAAYILVCIICSPTFQC